MMMARLRRAHPQLELELVLSSRLQDLVRPGDLVMTLGAGDVTLVGPLLVDQLKKRVSRG